MQALNNLIMDAFNLKPENIQSFRYEKKNDVYYIYITLADRKPSCPFCGGKAVIKDYQNRSYNHLPIFGYPSVIVWHRRRYVCRDDGHTFYEKGVFGPERFHQTYAVLRSIAIDLRSPHNTFKEIADRHHISSSIVQMYADSFLIVPRQPLPECLGIDEISSGMSKYGGSYLCALADNRQRTLSEILPDRSKRTISRYLEDIPLSERDHVRFVTMDLWDPYRDVAHKYFRNARIAADPCHVVSHLVDDFSKLRIDIMNQMVNNSPGYYLLKHWHKLFLADTSKLDNEPKYNGFFRQKMNYRDLFDLLLEISPELTLAYQLMDDYRTFNKTAVSETAEGDLQNLIEEFESASLPCYDEFVNLLYNWKDEIVTSCLRPYGTMRLSNALTEGMNGQLRDLLKVSNGYAVNCKIEVTNKCIQNSPENAVIGYFFTNGLIACNTIEIWRWFYGFTSYSSRPERRFCNFENRRFTAKFQCSVTAVWSGQAHNR